MSEQNSAIVRAFFDAWNALDLDAYDGLVAAGAQDHDAQNPFKDERGPEGVKRLTSMYHAGFSDSKITIEQQIADGDYVVSRWTATGTNDGEIMGMPATGKSVELSGITIDRIEDGKIAESWANWDTLGMMQQLGVVPEPQQA